MVSKVYFIEPQLFSQLIELIILTSLPPTFSLYRMNKMEASDIETSRLILRPLHISDAEDLTEIYSFKQVRDQLYVQNSILGS
jgi:hypothetical protein